jgi:hypothetical protein
MDYLEIIVELSHISAIFVGIKIYKWTFSTQQRRGQKKPKKAELKAF